MQPPTIAIRGAHRRSNSDPRSARAATMINVTSAVKGAAVGSTCDDLSSRSKTTEAKVMERIIITVPPTVGVTILLRMNSHLEMTSCTTADTSTSVVSVAGPPSTTAVMQKGMAKAAVNMGRTVPAPTGPRRRTCSRVARPHTNREAKTIHVRYASPLPDSWATTTGVTSSAAEAIRLNCSP